MSFGLAGMVFISLPIFFLSPLGDFYFSFTIDITKP